MPKRWFFLLFILLPFFIFPKACFAQVVINEFLPNPIDGADWVELYNTTSQDVSLDDWILDDEGTKSNMFEIEEATISAHGFRLFEVGSRLNKNSDTIFLMDNQGVVVDEYSYTSDPGNNISFGRMPDGESWGICSELTPGLENKCALPTSTPTPIPTSLPTNTPTPPPAVTPTKKPTSTPTKKLTSTPTPTKKLTPTPLPTVEPTLTATESGELESFLATPTGEILGETKEAGNSGQRDGETKSKVIAGLSIGAGGILIAAAGIWGKKKHVL